MKRFLFVPFILIFYPVLALASFDSAMRSYEQGNYSAAQQEFKNLAAQNDSDAQYMLGYMYAVGKGVLQDYIEAHKWFNIAASRGNRDAVKARNEVERQMTPEQIAQSQRKAREWQPGLYKRPVLTSNDIKISKPLQEPEVTDKNTVKQVQKKLAQLGYRPGSADGAMGDNTRKSIRQYQQDNRLKVDGRLTEALVTSLFPDGLPSDTIRKASAKGLLFANIWSHSAAGQGGVSKEHKQLLNELTSLLKQGRQKRAAQSWFLDDLAGLINQSQTDWSVLVLKDNFADGDYTFAPEWSVRSGSFEVNRNGLFSRMTSQPEQKQAAQPGNQNISTALLGAILDHAARGRNQGQSEPQPEAESNTPGSGRIITSKPIPNIFAMKVSLSLHSGEGRIEFGPYSSSNQGYQLLISPEQNRVELLRIDSRSSAVIESISQTISLNKAHTFEWLRDKDGNSIVAMDGKELFQVKDKRYSQGFSGFMLNNFASAMTLHDIQIVAKKQ